MSSVTLDNGIVISYYDQGTVGGPTVVLLPGPTDSWHSYEPILGSLPEDLRVLAMSLRGHGDSSKPASGYEVEDFASDVVLFLDALGIDRVVLAGHSGSCLAARRVALDRPDRVVGLLLEASPTTLRGDEKLSRFVESVVAELTEPIDRELARTFITDTSTGALAPELVERLVDDVTKVPADTWKQMFGSLLDYDDTTELSQLMAPTMLVWGDEDQLVSQAVQDLLVQLLPQAELEVYANVGHTPRWEQPGRFAHSVANFCARLSPS